MSGGGDLDPAVLGLDSVRRRTREWQGVGVGGRGICIRAVGSGSCLDEEAHP